MTKLKKPVYREVADWCRRGVFGLGGSSSRSLIVGMEPGPVITLREKGRRKTYVVDVESVFNMAVRAEHVAEVKAKAKKRRSSKKVVRRRRRTARR